MTSKDCELLSEATYLFSEEEKTEIFTAFDPLQESYNQYVTLLGLNPAFPTPCPHSFILVGILLVAKGKTPI